MLNSKGFAMFFSLMVTGAVLFPITENFKKKPQDNFPLSYYPMFSHKRDKDYALSYVVGYDMTGARHQVPYRYIGSGGFNQVRRQVNRYVREETPEKIAKRTCKRLSRCDEAPYNNLVRVEVITGIYNMDNYFINGDTKPLSEKVLCSQQIEKQ
jgi:hypothetical protein